MGKEADIRTGLTQAAICFARENHKEDIDKAYEYFWDEQDPEEFLSRTALEIGFINFEDWLISDYRVNKDNETLLDTYSRSSKKLNDDEMNILNTIKTSVLSLYEVESVSKEEHIIIRDLLLDGEHTLRDKTLAGGLKKGDIFATRLLLLDGLAVMSGCVYPFIAHQKETVLESVHKQFKRYLKNVDPHGTMKDYLKAYGDVLNLLWINLIIKQQSRKA
jgi:hypothetical protein